MMYFTQFFVNLPALAACSYCFFPQSSSYCWIIYLLHIYVHCWWHLCCFFSVNDAQ